MFFPRHFSIVGRRHASQHQPGQDAAYAAEADDFAVVVVSDGVGSAPLSQVGAGLLSRAAVHALLEELPSRSFDDVGLFVRELVEPMLRAVAASVGRESEREMLPATLVVGVLHDVGADIWAAGDGVAFVAGEGRVRVASDDVETITDPEQPGHVLGHLWQKLGREVRNIPYDLMRRPNADIPSRVLSVRGDVRGLYVGTDGLSEAPAVQDLLRHNPDSMHSAIREALVAAHPNDDASVAWASRVLRARLQGEALPRRRRASREDELAERIAEDYITRGYAPERALGIGYAVVQRDNTTTLGRE
jgi:serine/threonine protein phosphatase PrpC